MRGGEGAAPSIFHKIIMVSCAKISGVPWFEYCKFSTLPATSKNSQTSCRRGRIILTLPAPIQPHTKSYRQHFLKNSKLICRNIECYSSILVPVTRFTMKYRWLAPKHYNSNLGIRRVGKPQDVFVSRGEHSLYTEARGGGPKSVETLIKF